MKIKELPQEYVDKIKNNDCFNKDCEECFMAKGERCIQDEVEKYCEALDIVKEYGEKNIPAKIINILTKNEMDD